MLGLASPLWTPPLGPSTRVSMTQAPVHQNSSEKNFLYPQICFEVFDRVVLGDLQMFDWEIIEFRYFYLR